MFLIKEIILSIVRNSWSFEILQIICT